MFSHLPVGSTKPKGVVYSLFKRTQPCFSIGNLTLVFLSLQAAQANWSNYIALFKLPLSILNTLLLSSYCDRGRHKLPIILSLCGSLLSSLYLALLATDAFIDWPMPSVLAYAVFNRGFGGLPVVST